MMEIYYRADDGTRVRSVAFMSYRNPRGEWMVGDKRLRDLKQITREEWLLGGYDPQWAEIAMAMVR